MKKKIEHLTFLLKKNNIGVTDYVEASSSNQENTKDKKKFKGKDLVV